MIWGGQTPHLQPNKQKKINMPTPNSTSQVTSPPPFRGGRGKLLIIGGGAAGCFCAVSLKRNCPDLDVCVLEKGTRTMAKLAITGGGRCNLTNSFRQVKSTKQVYPRGEKLMKKLLKEFSNEDVMQWFEAEGVPLVVQDDECVFPKSQDAMQIVNLLNARMRQLGVRVLTRQNVQNIRKNRDFSYIITTAEGMEHEATHVVVTVGGKPQNEGFSFLESLSLDIIPPVPSLFTFNINDPQLHSLMGTVVEPASVKLAGTKLEASGPLLITHWGLSGPAILKLSSYGARMLAESSYKVKVVVNWLDEIAENDAFAILQQLQTTNPQKQISTLHPQSDSQTTPMTQKLWIYLIEKAGLQPEKRWAEVGQKQMRRLASILTADTFDISGKGQFKDEFVTCGGVSLSSIDHKTLESKQHKGLYFAGEVLDIDAITGGFNLQAAWSCAFVVSKAVKENAELDAMQ